MGNQKPFKATPPKLRKAKKAGDRLKSRESTALLTLSIGIYIIIYIFQEILTSLIEIIRNTWSAQDFDSEMMLVFLLSSFKLVAGELSGCFLGLFGLSLFIAWASHSFHPPFKFPEFKLSRANCFKNFARIVGFGEEADSFKLLFQLSKLWFLVFSLLFGLFASLVLLCFMIQGGLGELTEITEFASLAKILVLLMPWFFFPLVLLTGSVDLMVEEKWRAQRLAMTGEELKKDQKDSEGDPLVKGQRNKFYKRDIESVFNEKIRKSKLVLVDR